jgi:hypothetical protein
MRIVKAVADEVLGLFVADWIQAAVTVAIIVVAWFLIPRFHLAVIGFGLAIAIAAQLVFSTDAEARRMRAHRSR